MSNSVRLAIEVSRYMRRLIRELFQEGSGIPIGTAAYLLEDGDSPGIIDEFDVDSSAWQWANAVLMFMRALNGILENAEDEITDEL